ncbi:MAG: hypothetical protein LBI69_04860 [Puniceicoccales bacterium]|jgi:hypothetical protein|nr:hypothetical protein [Puniceicoccales bacterium]
MGTDLLIKVSFTAGSIFSVVAVTTTVTACLLASGVITLGATFLNSVTLGILAASAAIVSVVLFYWAHRLKTHHTSPSNPNTNPSTPPSDPNKNPFADSDRSHSTTSSSLAIEEEILERVPVNTPSNLNCDLSTLSRLGGSDSPGKCKKTVDDTDPNKVQNLLHTLSCNIGGTTQPLSEYIGKVHKDFLDRKLTLGKYKSFVILIFRLCNCVGQRYANPLPFIKEVPNFRNAIATLSQSQAKELRDTLLTYYVKIEERAIRLKYPLQRDNECMVISPTVRHFKLLQEMGKCKNISLILLYMSLINISSSDVWQVGIVRNNIYCCLSPQHINKLLARYLTKTMWAMKRDCLLNTLQNIIFENLTNALLYKEIRNLKNGTYRNNKLTTKIIELAIENTWEEEGFPDFGMQKLRKFIFATPVVVDLNVNQYLRNHSKEDGLMVRLAKGLYGLMLDTSMTLHLKMTILDFLFYLKGSEEINEIQPNFALQSLCSEIQQYVENNGKDHSPQNKLADGTTKYTESVEMRFQDLDAIIKQEFSTKTIFSANKMNKLDVTIDVEKCGSGSKSSFGPLVKDLLLNDSGGIVCVAKNDKNFIGAIQCFNKLIAILNDTSEYAESDMPELMKIDLNMPTTCGEYT